MYVTPRCSHKFAYIHTYIHACTRRQTEHLYGTARLHRLARSCEETTAREISSLRNLDEIARITWEPGRTRIYARAHARGRIHVVVGFCARNTTWMAKTCVYGCVYACRCTEILGVLTLRLVVEELRARNARTKRKKAIFRNDDDTATGEVAAT